MNPNILNRIKAELAVLFTNHPELVKDDQLRADVVEGETSLHEVLAILIKEEVDDKAIIKACECATETYESRSAAASRRIERRRATIQQIMYLANETSVRTPVGTVSISEGPRSVKIINDERIPERFVKLSRSYKLADIKAAIKAGEDVPGAALSNGATTLRVTI